MRKEIVLVFSDVLEEQILRVAKRIVNKDYAGLLRYFIWESFNNNREFIREAVNKGEFKCLTPEEFILEFQE